MERLNKLLRKRAAPKVINVGLASFGESLTRQGIEVVQVDFRPPAGGDERLAALLRKVLR